jgi:hypothetical protein
MLAKYLFFVIYMILSNQRVVQSSIAVDNNVLETTTDTWATHYGQSLNSTVQNSIDIIIKSVFENTMTNENELQSACQLILRNEIVHEIDFKNELDTIDFNFCRFPHLILIRLKSKCLAITGQIPTDQVNTALFETSAQQTYLKCNNNRVKDCKQFYYDVFVTQTARGAIRRTTNWTNILPIVTLCTPLAPNKTYESFFRNSGCPKCATLTSYICRIEHDGDDAKDADMLVDYIEDFYAEITSFFGTMGLHALHRAWCKLHKFNVINSNMSEAEYLAYLGQLSYKIDDYIVFKSLSSCFSNEINGMASIIEESNSTKSDTGIIEVFLKRMQSEFEKYKKLLQEQFQLHSKTLKDEFENYQNTLPPIVSSD